MATAIEPMKRCKEFNDGIIRMTRSLNRLKSSYSGLLFSLPRILFILIHQNRLSKKSLKEIRQLMNRCQKNCLGVDHEASCMTTIIDAARDIRDNYLSLHSSMSKTDIIPKVMQYNTEKILNDWDELVTDMTIGSDMEIRSLLFQIAEAV